MTTVYREGGTASGSIYIHFADAVSAINAAGVPDTIYVDGSLGQPVVLSGTYNLALVSLSEFPGQVNVSLNLDNGAVFNPAPTLIDNGLSLYSYSNSPVIDQANLYLMIQNGSWLQTSGTAPFIHVGSGATAQILLSETSYLAGSAAGSTTPIVSADASSTFTGVNVGNWCDVGAGALDGYGTIEVNLISSSATIESQSTAHALSIVNANTNALAAYGGLWSQSDAATTLTSGGIFYKVVWDTVFPVNSNMTQTIGTSYNLTILVPGVYQINSILSFQPQTSIGGNFIKFNLFHNGIAVPSMQADIAGITNQYSTISVSGLVNCAVNDTLDMRVFMNAGGYTIVMLDGANFTATLVG